MAEQVTAHGRDGVVAAAAPPAAQAGGGATRRRQRLRRGGRGGAGRDGVAAPEVRLRRRPDRDRDPRLRCRAGGLDRGRGCARSHADVARAGRWRESDRRGGPAAAAAGYAALADRGRLGEGTPRPRLRSRAVDGFAWAEVCTRLSRMAADLVAEMNPDGCVYYPDGEPIAAGTRVRLPGLAEVLREWVGRGAALLGGPVGDAIVAASRSAWWRADGSRLRVGDRRLDGVREAAAARSPVVGYAIADAWSRTAVRDRRVRTWRRLLSGCRPSRGDGSDRATTTRTGRSGRHVDGLGRGRDRNGGGRRALEFLPPFREWDRRAGVCADTRQPRRSRVHARTRARKFPRAWPTSSDHVARLGRVGRGRRAEVGGRHAGRGQPTAMERCSPWRACCRARSARACWSRGPSGSGSRMVTVCASRPGSRGCGGVARAVVRSRHRAALGMQISTSGRACPNARGSVGGGRRPAHCRLGARGVNPVASAVDGSPRQIQISASGTNAATASCWDAGQTTPAAIPRTTALAAAPQAPSRDLERAVHAERHAVLPEALDGEDVGDRAERTDGAGEQRCDRVRGRCSRATTPTPAPSRRARARCDARSPWRRSGRRSRRRPPSPRSRSSDRRSAPSPRRRPRCPQRSTAYVARNGIAPYCSTASTMPT